MSLIGGLFDFIGKAANRPDANPNMDTQRISSPDTSQYGVVNPNAAGNKESQQYLADAAMMTSNAANRKQQLDQLSQQISQLEKEATPNPYFHQNAAELQAKQQQLARLKGQMVNIQRDFDRFTQEAANSKQKAQNAAALGAEKVAKGYESRQIDPGAYGLMKSAAEGNQPSQAELAMKRQAGSLFNQSLSAASSARTYNPALARAAMFSNASGQADIAQRGGELRAGEMASARNAFGQYGLSQQSQNDAMANQMRGLNLGYTQMNQHGAIQGQEDLMKSQALNQADDQWRRGFAYNAKNARNQANQAMYGSLANTADQEDKKAQDMAGGMLGMFSDARAKSNIKPVGSLTDQFASITPVSYDYKPRFGGGSQVGVVAQDIEQTPVGKLMVGSKNVDGKKLKTIDQPAAVSTLLATAAEQAKRIKELEARTGGNVEIGAAQMNPRYDVEIGKAQIHPQSNVEIGQARDITEGVQLKPSGEIHPLTGRPMWRTASGEIATEMGRTVTDPRLNHGKPTNIPSIWDGKVFGEDGAVRAAVASGQSFPSFKSIPRAVEASKAHSAELGRYIDRNGRLYQEDFSTGPIIHAPEGVDIDTSGRTVLVDENVPSPQYFGPSPRYQGQPALAPSDRANLFSAVGSENRNMYRNPAMQLFGNNAALMPASDAQYAREMVQLAAKKKKRGGMI